MHKNAEPISDKKRKNQNEEEEERENGKQVDYSSLGDLETPLEAKKRPLRMKRKSQCLDSADTEEEVVANTRTRERKINMGKNSGNVQDKDEAMNRAEEVKSKLDKQFPSFLKSMMRSNVSLYFWLLMPFDFCKRYMPKENTIMVLEDETGQEYEVTYIARQMGLRAGWKRFSNGQNLLEGDIVVFHLVRFDKFKLYIVRASSSSETDGDDSNRATQPRDEREINNEDSSVQNMDADHHNSFIKFREFNIIANGANLDSLLTQDVRKNYYELCLARSLYLHHLLKSNNDMLAAGIILGTTKIADYIKECKISTSSDDLIMWDKMLEGFEVLGMDVGFLRARIEKLATIATQMRESQKFKEYEEARIHRDAVDEEIQNLKSRMNELECARTKLDSDIDASKAEVEKLEFIYEVEANISWS